jgi:response regulator RpfG family c-di-GMP phosphodiesterase
MQVNSHSAEDPKLHKNKQDQTAKEQSIHILLVEDFAGDTLLVQQVLATCSVDVKLHVARDGQQALTMGWLIRI